MRLIDADVMREDWLNNGLNESIYDTNDILNSIDEQPTIKAVPSHYGRWVESGDYIETTAGKKLPVKMCSACFENIVLEDFENYCPNCGAKMK